MDTRYWTKLTSEEFYKKGGFSNPKVIRTANGTGWTHWEEKPYKPTQKTKGEKRENKTH